MFRLYWTLVLLLAGGAAAAQAADSERVEPSGSAISRRLVLEAETDDNPFVITPHKPSYFLPLTYSSDPNARHADPEYLEMMFQVSFKIPIARDFIGGNTRLTFGYTQVTYWQAYAASGPFRETNHEPELMLSFLHERPVGPFTSRVLTIGLNHQSNGQGGAESRSWNRLYADLVLERGDWYLSLKPWWRIPESRKEQPTDLTGDDNPDIEDYMGNFELRLLRYHGIQTFGLTLRNNLQRENRGAGQVDWTYPLGTQLRGYVQLFSGYGESLIDYDHFTNRIGVGVMLTNWL